MFQLPFNPHTTPPTPATPHRQPLYILKKMGMTQGNLPVTPQPAVGSGRAADWGLSTFIPLLWPPPLPAHGWISSLWCLLARQQNPEDIRMRPVGVRGDCRTHRWQTGEGVPEKTLDPGVVGGFQRRLRPCVTDPGMGGGQKHVGQR